MLAVVLSMKRLHVLGVMLLTMVFLAPAFETHACAPVDGASTTLEQTVEARSDAEKPGQSCPDCGPACANGCCHAPHPAVIADPHKPALTDFNYAPVRPWSHDVGPALGPPSGPDRPPRP